MSHQPPPGLGSGALEDFLDVFTSETQYDLEYYRRTMPFPALNPITTVAAAGYRLFECYARFEDLTPGEYLVTYSDGRARNLMVGEDGILIVRPPDYYEPDPDPDDPEEMTWPPLTFSLRQVIRGQVIENETVAVCEPLAALGKEYISNQCYTAECPSGQIGPAVTRCATATSKISQADADAKALAAAQAAAEAELECLPLPVVTDEADLNITLDGLYDLVPFIEYANLIVSLSGEYAIAPFEDLAELTLEMDGVYTLVPFVEYSPLSIGISPISQYAIAPFLERPDLNIRLVGTYAITTTSPDPIIERETLALSLTGAYTSVTISEIVDDEGSLVLTMAGAYTLTVAFEDITENGTLVCSLVGDYVARIVDAGNKIENQTLRLSLTGSYHT